MALPGRGVGVCKASHHGQGSVEEGPVELKRFAKEDVLCIWP